MDATPAQAPVAVAPEPPTDGIPRYSHPEILRVVTGVMLCILLAALDQTVVVPAVPAIAADLNGFGHLAWIVTAYLLTSTAVVPIYGKLSDQRGRRKLLLFALTLFMVASVLCGLAQSLPQLIAARALQGIGGGGLMAMAQSAIADVVLPRDRGRYQGYMAGMWGVASIAGPVVGGWFTDHLSWRWVFWINVPLGLAAMFLCDRALRAVPVRRLGGQIDFIGAVLLIGGVTCWLLMLSWAGTEYAWSSPVILGLAVGGAVLLAALALAELRVADPLLPPRLFRHNEFVRAVLVGFFVSLAMFGATFALPLVFQLIGGVDASESGVLVMPFLLSSVVGAFTSGQMARRIGRTKVLVLLGLCLCLAGFVLLALIGLQTPFWLIMLPSMLLGLGIGCTMPTLLMGVQNAAERRDVGVATGSMLFLRSLGGAFGSTVVGAVLAGRFAAGLTAAGLPSMDLGALHAGSGVYMSLSAAARETARAALLDGFRTACLLCAGLVLVAVLIAWGMRDIELRGAATPTEIGH